ncbi:MAG: NAD(P)-binding protein [Candidatus Vogelbacteria bacterium]|nr:NAD(P)-binding protein [Candidatus Vogelbacteria bacterium]
MQGKFSTGTLSREAHEVQDSRYREGHKYDIVIIGTGMAALTFAALEAHSGKKVCMLEAHDVPGGYAHSFKYPTKYGEFSFCAQVHYIWGCGPGGLIQDRARTFASLHEF